MYDPHSTPPHQEDPERVKQVERMLDMAGIAFLTVIVTVIAESYLVDGLAPRTVFEKTLVYTAAVIVPVCAAALFVGFCRRAYDAYRRSAP